MEYYRSRLVRAEREAYAAMLRGYQTLERVIRVPALPGRRLSELSFLLRLDHPEIFYIESLRCRTAPGAENTELLPDYLFDRGRIQTHRQALEARVTRLAREAARVEGADRVRFLHDFLCEGVRYDKLKKAYSHEALGPLTQGVGVCEGIAKSLKLLCDRLELPCIVAISQEAPGEGVPYRHAWNVVRLGKEAYHVDATYDLSLSAACGQTRRDYLLLDDRAVFRDHRPLVEPVPACTDATAFYYRTARLSLTKLEDVEKRVQQAVRKKKASLVLHWRGGPLTRTTLAQLLETAARAAQAGGKFCAASVNRPQAVLCLQFSDAPCRKDAVLEQADETQTLPDVPETDGGL